MSRTPALGRPATVDTELILDAAAALMTDAGIGPLTLVAVADRAGVSRRTVYRYFADRAALIDAVIERERDRFVAAALAAAEAHNTLNDALEQVVATVLERAATHALFGQLRRTDPDVLYPLLLSTSGLVIEVVVRTASTLLATYQPVGSPELSPAAVEMFSRLLVSYVADPPTDHVDEIASTFAMLLCALVEQDAPRSLEAAR